MGFRRHDARVSILSQAPPARRPPSAAVAVAIQPVSAAPVDLGTSPDVFRIERLEVRASLDDPRPALDQARARAAAGDASWAQWVADHERGEALIVRLEVSVVAMDHAREVIETGDRGVFVENDVHPARLEQQIAELVREDVPAITAWLNERGQDIDLVELAEMYVHVELDAELRAAASGAHPAHYPRGETYQPTRPDSPRAPDT